MESMEIQLITNGEPPQEDHLKLNVDASVVAGQNSFAVGMVLRNSQGHFIAGKIMRFSQNYAISGAVIVLEAELTGIWEAMVWSRDVAESPVIVESDSLLSIQAINNGHDNILESGDLVQQCQEEIRSSSRISVSHVKKQANKVAHNLARIPCELNCFTLFSSPPSCLLETLLSEVLVF